MTERPRKRSLTIKGHRTSVSIEDTFWNELKEISKRKNRSVNLLVAYIDEARTGDISLAGAIRQFIFLELKELSRGKKLR